MLGGKQILLILVLEASIVSLGLADTDNIASYKAQGAKNITLAYYPCIDSNGTCETVYSSNMGMLYNGLIVDPIPTATPVPEPTPTSNLCPGGGIARPKPRGASGPGYECEQPPRPPELYRIPTCMIWQGRIVYPSIPVMQRYSDYPYMQHPIDTPQIISLSGGVPLNKTTGLCDLKLNASITITPISTPTKTSTPVPINTPIPTEVDKNDATIVQPCDNDSKKMCESIMKNGVTVYKGPVYPEMIDINNPSEPIFPIQDPRANIIHVGISHSCYPTGNTPTYSQICDASYINGRLTYIMKYTYIEYPCSSDVSGICRQKSEESIPVRTPIVLITPTNTPGPTITNTPTEVSTIDYSRQVTAEGYAKVKSISQDTVEEQDKGIIEMIKELFTNIWREYVG